MDASAAGERPGNTRLMNLTLDALDSGQVLDHIETSLRDGRGGVLINPNLDVLRQAVRSDDLAQLVGTADLVIADGAPLEWAARVARHPLPGRVPGATLIWQLAERCAATGSPIFLLGGDTGVPETAAQRLQAAFPTLKVAGTYSPPYGFEKDAQGIGQVTERLRSAQPAVVFCGLGFPKQERLMVAMRDRFPNVWFIGSGASIAFAAGVSRRAPAWVQRIGFEWMHRLVMEPRRLFHRYIIDDIPFGLRLMSWALRARYASAARSN